MNSLVSIETKLKTQIYLFGKSLKERGVSEVLVATSGGADSMLVLSLLKETLAPLGGPAIVAIKCLHVNYNLRGVDSLKDEELVEKTCKDLGVTFFKKSISKSVHPTDGYGIQEWARNIRYEFFGSYLGGNKVIALGHHQDDLAENILFRMARGSHISNLMGMEVYKDFYWRPLLQINKKEILDLVSRKKIPYREDISNDKLVYSRNIIRHNILPVLDKISVGAGEKVVDSVFDATEISNFVEEMLLKELKKNEFQLFTGYLKGLPDAVATLALSLIIKNGLGREAQLTRKYLRLMLEKIRSTEVNSGPIHLPLDKGGFLVISSQKVFFEKNKSPFSKFKNRHRFNLFSEKWNVLLPRDSKVYLDRDFARSKGLKINNSSKESFSYQVYTPGPKETFIFDGQEKKWKLKDLVHFLQPNDKKLRILKRNGKNIGVFLENTFVESNSF